MILVDWQEHPSLYLACELKDKSGDSKIFNGLSHLQGLVLSLLHGIPL